MYRLITLGAADLLGPDGHRVNSVVQQPKRFLLLAYLTLAPRGAPVRRDALLHLFWPEADEAQARHNLKQAVYFIRRSLDAAAVVDGHDNLLIAGDVLSCDAAEMEAALAAGEHRRVLDLYRGEFLPGLFVDGSGEVEDWLEERRARYHRLAVEAARGLARAEQSRGNAPAAAHWGRRVAELAGASEPLMLEAMSLLVDCGDRAGAAEVYAGFERRLQSELEVGPSRETQFRAQRLLAVENGRNGDGVAHDDASPPATDSADAESGGPPAAAGGIEADAADAAAAADRPDATGSRRSGRKPMRWRDVAVLPVILVLALLASLHALSDRPAGEEEQNGAVVAAITVRDFDHHGAGSEAAAVASALPAIARRELAAVRGLVVLSPSAPQPAVAAAAAVRGRDRVDTYAFEVRGTVRARDGELRADLALWESGSGRLIRAFSVTHPASDPEEAVEALGRRIASTVRTEIGRERRARMSMSAAPDPRAWEAVQVAEELIKEAHELRRRGMVEAAVAGLTRADSLLGAAEVRSASWNAPSVARAKAASARAWLALMPPVADASLAKAEFEQALSHAARAVSRSPDDPAAREIRGTIAYWMWEALDLEHSYGLDLLGSAEADLNLAIKLDPARVRAWILLGHMAYMKADFTASYWATKQAYELDTYHEHAQELLTRLFATAYELGDYIGAERWCAELRHHFPSGPTGAYCAIAGKAWVGPHALTDVDTAWTMIRELSTSRTLATIRPKLELMIASVLAGAGLADSAEAVIRRAQERGGEDAELLYHEAHARALLGQADSAAALLFAYVKSDPRRRSHVAQSRRFETLISSRAIPLTAAAAGGELSNP